MHNCPGVCSKIVLRKIGKHFSLKNKGIWGGGIDICGKKLASKGCQTYFAEFRQISCKIREWSFNFCAQFWCELENCSNTYRYTVGSRYYIIGTVDSVFYCSSFMYSTDFIRTVDFAEFHAGNLSKLVWLSVLEFCDRIGQMIAPLLKCSVITFHSW